MTQELNKQEATKQAVDRIAKLLQEIDTLKGDIDSICQETSEKYGVKGPTLKGLAQELLNGKSTETIAKHQEIVDELSTLGL